MLERWGTWIWISIYAIGLLLLLTPFSLIVVHVLMVPLLVLFSRKPFAQAVVPFLIILAFYSLLNLSIGTLMFLVSLFLLTPALWMGKLNREQKHPSIVIFTGFAVILGQVLLILMISYGVYQINLIHWFREQIDAGFQLILPIYDVLLPEADMERQFILLADFIETLATSIILIFSVYYAWISYMIARWILHKQSVSLPEYVPLRAWRLPRSLIWFNIIAIILGFIVDDRESFLYALHINMFFILLLVFWVQGIGFLAYWSHRKKWGKALPIIGVIMSVFSPFLYLFSIIGMIDLLFPLRGRTPDKVE